MHQIHETSRTCQAADPVMEFCERAKSCSLTPRFTSRMIDPFETWNLIYFCQYVRGYHSTCLYSWKRRCRFTAQCPTLSRLWTPPCMTSAVFASVTIDSTIHKPHPDKSKGYSGILILHSSTSIANSTWNSCRLSTSASSRWERRSRVTLGVNHEKPRPRPSR